MLKEATFLGHERQLEISCFLLNMFSHDLIYFAKYLFTKGHEKFERKILGKEMTDKEV